jgi:hypothetical protein
LASAAEQLNNEERKLCDELHRMSGYEDTKRTIKRRDWMSMPPAGAGILVHDVHHQQE